MEPTAPSRHVLPPWNNPAFLTEAGLKEAQEYFFQTHATNSRMIAQGREATGFMKGHIRRKLAKEMGEDFKMYTGVALGTTGGEDAESKGIRGELNELLKHVYLKIAPTQPIISPIQEDLTILRHPLGGLEVLFAMGCFYTDLMKRYASLAGDRRKVLKSVLDEEVFKWVWRTFYALVMADKKVPPTFRETIPSSGIRFVPVDKQRLDSRAKLVEFGEFLLGSGLGQSHLRFPLCFYFVNMLRQIQYRLLPVYDRNVVEAVFRKIQKRTPNEAIDDVLVAIDVLMNTKGNTQQSFDDVLANEERDVQNFVPPPEIQFIDSFQEFQGAGFNPSMKKFIPQVTKEEILEGQGVTLMPLLLLLRTLPYATTERILEKVPGPFLNLLKNRIAHGNIDDVGRGLLDRIDEMIKARRQRGEQYTIYGSSGRVSSKREAAKAEAAEAAPDSKKPAGAPKVAPGGETLEPGVAHEEAPAAGAPQAAKGADALLHEPLVVDWQADNGSITVFSLAAQDIIDLGGADPRLLLPWVLFALRTGQVFSVPPQEVSREKVESLLRDLVKASGQGAQARLSADQRKALYEKNKGQPPGKVLIALLKDFGIEGMPIDAQGPMAAGIVGLQKKLGNQLQAFIMNPNQEGFKAYLQELTGPERQAVRVLNRVAKTQ